MPSAQSLMKQRFHELRDEIVAIEQAAAPLRAAREAVVARLQEIERELPAHDAAIRQTEAGLYERKNELALLARALSGNTAAE
jgi:septal ring factor EnvC (AmiA/AmiB activator)